MKYSHATDDGLVGSLDEAIPAMREAFDAQIPRIVDIISVNKTENSPRRKAQHLPPQQHRTAVPFSFLAYSENGRLLTNVHPSDPSQLIDQVIKPLMLGTWLYDWVTSDGAM